MQEVKPAQDFQRSRRDNLTRRWNLPAQNKSFTGRQNLLDQISERLSGSKPLVITACHGLGGVGKTQLVTEFAYRNQDKYERIIWIPSESSAQIEGAYLALGHDLGILPEETLPAEAVYRVKTWLSLHPRNLLIFDNAPDHKTVSEYLLPSGADVFITSRHREWPEKSIEVNVFSLQEAILYFKNIVGERENDTDEKIEELAEELGCLPLALAQATAYIRQHKVSIQSYLDLYRIKKDSFLSSGLLPVGDHHVAVYITWDATMEKIVEQSVLSPLILNACSCLHSDGIPLYVLQQFVDTEKNNPKIEILEEAIGLLKIYSLVVENEQGDRVSLHRLLQHVIRHKLIKERALFLDEMVEHLAQVFTRLLYKEPSSAAYKIICTQGEVISHVQSFLQNYVNEIDISKKGVTSVTMLQIFLLLSDIHIKLNTKNDLGVAIVYLNFGLTYCLEIKDKKMQARVRYLLAKVYFEKREFESAKKGIAQCEIVVNELDLDENDPKRADAFHTMGSCYRFLGDLPNALRYIEKALEVRRHSDNIINLMSDLISVSSTHFVMGNLIESGKYAAEAFKICQEQGKEDHPYAAWISYMLGQIHSKGDDLNKAIFYYMDALARYKKSLKTDEHRDIGYTLHALGNAYLLFNTDKHIRKAIEYFEQALDMRRRLSGEDSFHVIVTLFAIASAYCALHDSKEAERAAFYYEEVLRIVSKKISEDSASLTLFKGELEKARKIFVSQEILKKIEILLGERKKDVEAVAQFGLHHSPPQPLKREKLEESQEKLACKK